MRPSRHFGLRVKGRTPRAPAGCHDLFIPTKLPREKPSAHVIIIVFLLHRHLICLFFSLSPATRPPPLPFSLFSFLPKTKNRSFNYPTHVYQKLEKRKKNVRSRLLPKNTRRLRRSTPQSSPPVSSLGLPNVDALARQQLHVHSAEISASATAVRSLRRPAEAAGRATELRVHSATGLLLPVANAPAVATAATATAAVFPPTAGAAPRPVLVNIISTTASPSSSSSPTAAAAAAAALRIYIRTPPAHTVSLPATATDSRTIMPHPSTTLHLLRANPTFALPFPLPLPSPQPPLILAHRPPQRRRHRHVPRRGRRGAPRRRHLPGLGHRRGRAAGRVRRAQDGGVVEEEEEIWERDGW